MDISLPVEGSVIAMTKKGKAFRKRKWWLMGDDEQLHMTGKKYGSVAITTSLKIC